MKRSACEQWRRPCASVARCNASGTGPCRARRRSRECDCRTQPRARRPPRRRRLRDAGFSPSAGGKSAGAFIRRRAAPILIRSAPNAGSCRLPTAVGLRKVVMSDKWQQINLRLDAPLAQALRELKQGHDESLSEVIIRLLRKVVRVVPSGSRGAPLGRQNPRGGAVARGSVGGKRRGKPAPAGRGASRVAAPGKPWVARAPGAWEADGNAEPARPRAPRRSGGKPGPAWTQGLEGTSEPRRRGFRAGNEG